MNRGTITTVGTAIGSMLAVFMLSGCISTLAPTFTTNSVRELETVDGRTRMMFMVNAQNPNKEPIPLEQVSYRVSIDGVEVFAGVRSPSTTLPGYASMSFELPAIVASSLINAHGEIGYAIDGMVRYHNPGAFAEVLYDADLKIPEAPLQIEGTINLGQ